MRSHYDELPVSWHQCLLIFAQIYAKDLSSEQRDALIELTKVFNYKIKWLMDFTF
jgi:hypothetical protein